MKVDIFNTDKKYNIIYADPPWRFGSKNPNRRAGRRWYKLDEVYTTQRETDIKKQ